MDERIVRIYGDYQSILRRLIALSMLNDSDNAVCLSNKVVINFETGEEDAYECIDDLTMIVNKLEKMGVIPRLIYFNIQFWHNSDDYERDKRVLIECLEENGVPKDNIIFE